MPYTMRVLCATIPAKEYSLPMVVPVARGIAERGHAVAFETVSEFHPELQAEGVRPFCAG